MNIAQPAKTASKLIVQLLLAGWLLSVSALVVAQAGTDTWTAPALGPKSYGYFDPTYPTPKDPAQHLGVDIDLKAGDVVLSPVDGVVFANNTVGYSADVAHLIIKDNATGVFHVLGHISSNLKQKTTVSRGAAVGTVMIWIDEKGHDNSHLHWGANIHGIDATAAGKWGWGRAPNSATPAQAKERGWVDVTPYLSRARPLVSGSPQGPVKPAPYSATMTLGKTTFNLPPESQLIPDAPCKDPVISQVRKSFPQASRCVGQMVSGATTILVFDNWQRTETDPGVFRVISFRKVAVDLGSISVKDGVQAILVEGKYFELIAVTLKSWSKKPDDPPYLRYRYTETGGAPRLVLIPNALSARQDNPIRRDISSLNNPLGKIFRRPATTADSQPTRQAGTDSTGREPVQRTPQGGSKPACATADWTGVIHSIPDLFECDTPRAISSLSQGRQAQILVQSISFTDGKYVVIFSDRPSHTNQAIKDMNNKQFDWGKWNDATQSKFFRIVCVFQPAVGSRLREGEQIVVNVILQNFAGGTAQFVCS